MKRIFLLASLVFLISGCIERVERPVDEFDKAQVIQACEQIIDEFQNTLKKELVAAMSEGSLENAIGVCHTVAPKIADSFSAMTGIDIRRVSLRPRNRQIIPDSFEVEGLAKLIVANKVEPQIYSELVIDSGRVKHYRYMKEIKVGQLCLRCHGDPSQFSQGLKKALAENYPLDRAVGYNLGDSRGAFSVYVRYPEAKATITDLLSENGR